MQDSLIFKPVIISAALASWLATGERGSSSEFIAERLSGMPAGTLGGKWSVRGAYPLDPSDFRRCYLLLQAVPEFADRLPEISDANPTWQLYVNRWPEMVRLYEMEAPDGRCPILYRLMQQLQEQAREELRP